MKKFPFGQTLRPVIQTDRTPKEVFVLGVYASAVHARWIGPDGKQKVSALAVDSEPYIFWRGDDADEIISKIKIPSTVGRLTEPSRKGLNGPSGVALDERFLDPLGIERDDAWLCDLLPESRMNPAQRKAIDKHYLPLCAQHRLPVATIPEFNKTELDSKKRRKAILKEIKESGAHTLILLGDLPIHWFLKYHTEPKYTRLSQFGTTADTYGKKHAMDVDGISMDVIPLCHPRQAGQLGRSNSKWGALHAEWVKKRHEKKGRRDLILKKR